MKIGIENTFSDDNIIVTSTVTPLSGKAAGKILTKDSLEVWQVEQGAVTLTLDFTAAASVQLLCLFNVICETNVTIKTYDAGLILIESKTITAAELTGLDINNTLFELTETDPIKRIELVYTGATASFLTSTGFIWGGDVLDFGCLESFVYKDSTADTATISRAQTGSIKSEYNAQAVDFIFNKALDFYTLRGKVRQLFAAGLFTSRPFIFNEPLFFPTPEVMLAIFDAPLVQYDALNTDTGNIAQSTLGVTEVFG